MRPPTTVAELETWLEDSRHRERSGDYGDCKLEGVRAVLEELPAPPRPVTVAGTKGKGSTVRLMEGVLLAAGRSTVAFASPHVDTVLERWRVDGANAGLAELASLVPRVAAAEERAGVVLTYFERCFALVCLLAVERPDATFLCEVGLGGRLDCANVLDARLALVTRLGLDHCHVLGDSLEAIAAEKLAVARPDAPLLVGPQSPAGRAAVEAVLPERVTAAWVAPEAGLPTVAMAGAHQRDNAALAIAAARILVPDLADAAVATGLACPGLPGRCELVVLPGGRRVLLDGAHTDESVAATLAVAHEKLRPGWRLVLGLARDKDVDRVLGVLGGIEPIRCGYGWPRARTEVDWSDAARAWPWCDRIADALAACPGVDLCITGSFYLAGEARAALAGG